MSLLIALTNALSCLMKISSKDQYSSIMVREKNSMLFFLPEALKHRCKHAIQHIMLSYQFISKNQVHMSRSEGEKSDFAYSF